MNNCPETVCDVLATLREGGVESDLFGGWAEEVLGLCLSRPHADIDLVYRGSDFSAVDAFLTSSAGKLDEVTGKRFRHKRAFRFRGVVCEILLVQDWQHQPFTLFWGDTLFHWNTPFLHPEAGYLAAKPISLVHEDNLRKYRAEFKSTGNQRWCDPSSRIP
jgi:hypothetical protein